MGRGGPGPQHDDASNSEEATLEVGAGFSPEERLISNRLIGCRRSRICQLLVTLLTQFHVGLDFNSATWCFSKSSR